MPACVGPGAAGFVVVGFGVLVTFGVVVAAVAGGQSYWPFDRLNEQIGARPVDFETEDVVDVRPTQT